MALFDYTLEATSGHARAGSFETAHGIVRTPLFMPVGTSATVKGIRPETLHEIGAQIILANTYHLSLRPGADLVEEAGGLHSFMNYSGPILTDSGGFQVFSLADTLKLDEDGLTFKSIYDGSKIRWTPESNMEVQQKLGADIVMQLDQCTPYPQNTTSSIMLSSFQPIGRGVAWRPYAQRPDAFRYRAGWYGARSAHEVDRVAHLDQ